MFILLNPVLKCLMIYFIIIYLSRTTRPVFVELPVWPALNLSGDPGSCPFNTKRREKLEKLRAEVKENREGIQPINQEEVMSNVHFVLYKVSLLKCAILH